MQSALEDLMKREREPKEKTNLLIFRNILLRCDRFHVSNLSGKSTQEFLNPGRIHIEVCINLLDIFLVLHLIEQPQELLGYILINYFDCRIRRKRRVRRKNLKTLAFQAVFNALHK